MSLIINMHFGQIRSTQEEAEAVLVYNLSPFRQCAEGQCPVWLEDTFGHFIQNGIVVEDRNGKEKDLDGETISRSLAFIGLIEQIKLLKITAKMISERLEEDSIVVLNVAKAGVLGKYLLRFIAGLADKHTTLRFFDYPASWNEMLQKLPSTTHVYSLLIENKRVKFGETLDGPIEFNPNRKNDKKKHNHNESLVDNETEVEIVKHEEIVEQVKEEKPKIRKSSKKPVTTEAETLEEEKASEFLAEQGYEVSDEISEVAESLEPEVPVKKATRKRTKPATPPVDAVDAEEALNKLANKFPVKRGKK